LIAVAAAIVSLTSTAYCLSGTMADQTQTRAGSVAMNSVPLGTRVHPTRRVFGRKHFVVRDRIGWGTELDFWTPDCTKALRYGRRTITIRTVKP
jgi:hypothetical protein